MAKAKGSAESLKQALQARAAIYGEMLDPSWFRSAFNLSGKVTNIRNRRRARAMLIGSVLLTGQLGLQDIRRELSKGDRNILDNMRPDQYGTVTQFKKALREAPVLQILEFIDGEKSVRINNAFKRCER